MSEILTSEEINRLFLPKLGSDETPKDAKIAFQICRERIKTHKLEMRLVSVCFFPLEILFLYTAKNKVDFQKLEKDLAGIFKVRVELEKVTDDSYTQEVAAWFNSVCDSEFLHISENEMFEEGTFPLSEDLYKAMAAAEKQAKICPVPLIEINKALNICKERIKAHKLEMELVHCFPAESKILFLYTAENQIDFRELVKDLESIFKIKIEFFKGSLLTEEEFHKFFPEVNY